MPIIIFTQKHWDKTTFIKTTSVTTREDVIGLQFVGSKDFRLEHFIRHRFKLAM